MTSLLLWKEQLKQFYNKYSYGVQPVIRFLFALCTFLSLNANIGYMNKLKNPLVIILVCLVSSLLPYGAIVFLSLIHICHKKGDILNLFFEEFVEEHLVQPTFVMDHPIEISPLTKKKPENPEYVERFEFFMNGWEMANAYSELNDPIDQRERFKAQEELLAQGDEEANHTDEDFIPLGQQFFLGLETRCV